jgi:hypothetical protein
MSVTLNDAELLLEEMGRIPIIEEKDKDRRYNYIPIGAFNTGELTIADIRPDFLVRVNDRGETYLSIKLDNYAKRYSRSRRDGMEDILGFYIINSSGKPIVLMLNEPKIAKPLPVGSAGPGPAAAAAAGPAGARPRSFFSGIRSYFSGSKPLTAEEELARQAREDRVRSKAEQLASARRITPMLGSTGNYSGGKSKRRHTKRRKSRKARKARKSRK